MTIPMLALCKPSSTAYQNEAALVPDFDPVGINYTSGAWVARWLSTPCFFMIFKASTLSRLIRHPAVYFVPSPWNSPGQSRALGYVGLPCANTEAKKYASCPVARFQYPALTMYPPPGGGYALIILDCILYLRMVWCSCKCPVECFVFHTAPETSNVLQKRKKFPIWITEIFPSHKSNQTRVPPYTATIHL